MKQWKINLIVLWFGQFLTMAGITMIMPFLVLFLQRDLHVENTESLTLWSGLIFSSNFITTFLFQPLWGKLADRYGKKLMLLRSSFGMAIIMVLMGFTTAPWQLLLLRLLNGVVSGFSPAATSLVSSNTPKEQLGSAMGLLQSGSISGTILGPLIGGLIVDIVGFRPIFYLTGGLLLLASLLTWFFVKETVTVTSSVQETSVLSGIRQLASIKPLVAVYFTSFMMQYASLSLMTLVPLFIQGLCTTPEKLGTITGTASSISGIAMMISASFLGRLSQQIGAAKVLYPCLFLSGACFIFQAFAPSLTVFILIRFISGLANGGLFPSINTLIAFCSPKGMESRAYSMSSSTQSIANFLAPLTGGLLASYIGIPGVFIFSGILLLIASQWVRKVLLPLQSRNC